MLRLYPKVRNGQEDHGRAERPAVGMINCCLSQKREFIPPKREANSVGHIDHPTYLKIVLTILSYV